MRRSTRWLVLLFLHVLVFVYPTWRIGLWVDAPLWLLGLLTLPLFCSQYIARKHLYKKHHRATRNVAMLRTVIDYTLGVFGVAALVLLVFEAVFLFWSPSAFEKAQVTLTIIAFFVAWGSVAAWRPLTRRVRKLSVKLDRQWRIVQLSDVHIGSRSRWFLRYLRWRVNRMRPDLICITGDLVDQPGLDEQVLGDLARFHAPVYYVTGNHERYEDFEAIMQRLHNLGCRVLRNQRDDWETLSIIGIDDAEDREQVAKTIKDIPIDPERFNVLLYHKPLGLRAAAAAGIDLMLCGHTHGGQIWPFHLAVKNEFSRHKGEFSEGDTLMYVSEGTGTWGPTLRLFSHSEITLIEIGP